MTSPTPQELLAFARAIALEAGELLLDAFKRPFTIDRKGSINLVTEMDLASERLLTAAIRDRYPHHTILAEESGLSGTPQGDRWIIDPLDGTTNYAHRWPHFAISIAFERDGEILLGFVYNPAHQECFWAIAGEGAYLNGERLHVSQTAHLSDALLNTGFPYDIREKRDNYAPFIYFIDHAQTVRRTGVAALDLCWVAAGRVDAYWEPRLFPWDVAAGALIVREAGGYVTHFDGSPFSHYGTEILASNTLIHDQVIEGLRQSLGQSC